MGLRQTEAYTQHNIPHNWGKNTDVFSLLLRDTP